MARRSTRRDPRAELAAAFTELGPAWGRWVTACTPAESVSYSRMRLLRVLEQSGDRTMTQLAWALRDQHVNDWRRSSLAEDCSSSVTS